MSKLKKLQARKAGLIEAVRQVCKAADDEGRQLNDTEQAAYNEHKEELAAINAAIEREQALLEFERSLIPVGEAEPPVSPPQTPVATPVSPATLPDPNQAAADAKRWKSLGEFLTCVYRASVNPRDVDPRLVQPAANTGLGESIGSEGGFLVHTDYVATLMMRTYDNTVLLNGGPGYSGVSRVPLGPTANGVKIPAVNEMSRANGSRWGGVQAYWQEEGGTKTATKPDFRQITLNLKKLIGLCYATDELLQDATALEAIISLAFAEEFAFKIQDALVNGTGAGQPLGILNAGCLVTVAKESTQSAAGIVKANIDKMYSRMWARGVGRAVWLINQDCWPQLYALADAGNNAVFMPPGGMSARPYAMLMGRPVVPIEQCQTMGTKGDIFFADFSEYLWIDKGNMQSAQSIHVKFTTDETAFRFVFRCDGEPAWAAALTPYKGANSLSPFITLATRP